MAQINYTATADLKSFSTWLTNNIDQNASTWDSTTQEGVLVLNSGVTEIGLWAFNNCTALITITLPEGITSIKQQAFYACYGLTSVTFPESLTGIGTEAFLGSSHLDNFTIPATVTGLYRNSFIGTGWWNSQSDGIIYKDGWCLGYKGSKPVGSINIQNNTKSICYNAFSNCTGLTSVTFPESLTIIDYSTFDGCTGLTSVTFPESLTTIGRNAFGSCTGLTSVTFPESVTTINVSAFDGCTGLTSVTFPESVAYIEISAFNNCTNLLSVTCLATTPPSLGPNNFGVSGDTLKVLPSALSAYQNNSSWNSAFTNIEALHVINYTATADLKAFSSWCTNNVDQNASTWDSGTGEGVLVLNSGVTEVGNVAFYQCVNLLTINIPNVITTIQSSAFSGCTGLTSITLPDSLTVFQGFVFSGCTGLTSITLPDSLTVFYGGSNFKNCTGLTSIDLSSVADIGNNDFIGCTGLTTVTFGNSLKKIGYSAFQNCTNLVSFNIPQSVISIGGNSFKNTSWWNSQVNGIIYKDNWCLGYKNITPSGDIIIDNNIYGICADCFNGYTGITSITLPDSLLYLCDQAFYGCTGLTTMTFPNSLTKIGAWVLLNCPNLTTIYWNAIDTSWISIGDTVFWGNSSHVSTLILGDSVQNIPNKIFGNNNNLTTVTSLATIPPTLGTYNFTASDDTLWVKGSSKAAYEANTSWRNAFTYIKGIYTITTSAGQGGTITPTTEVLEGESFTVTATPNAHYKVSHFIVDGVDVGTIDNYTFQNLDADHTIHVDFELITHNIEAYTRNGGSISPTGNVVVNDGDSQTFTITPDTHYYISDITVDGVSVGAVSTYTFTNVTENHIIYAIFTKYTHTITATAYEGGAIVPSGAITVNEGENQSFDIIPLEGYGILAVFIDGTQIEPVETYTFTDVEADHTIQAMFYPLRVAGFNRDEMLDINYIIQDYLEQLKKRV